MELLYNPDVMPEEEIKATFVARQPLVDEIVGLIEKQPDGAGVQHIVIIAPRGMGKTTVLLMVKYGIKDKGLSDKWQAVKFREESYGIYDLADFWVEVLNLLSLETGDDAPQKQAEELKKQYKKNDDLQEAALAAIKDWRKRHGKRLVLLVENFDMILSQINDEKDNASLRDTLMNDGTMMLIGGATTFFKEARAYNEPLYNFFKIYNLYDLKFEQMQELLSRRAEVDKIVGFDPTSLENRVHLRALKYFTGGNPRLVLMLYRVVTQSNITEVRRALEKLLDEVTPFYKAKIEILPPQQRKIVDQIAQVSSKTSTGLTPGEIAEAVRLPPNQVSSQLKRLSEIGYVRAANLRGRSSYYTLSEPLYAIWHQMRFGRAARQRMEFLINFLRVFYSREEFMTQSEKMDGYFRDHLKSNRLREARDTLEYHSYLAEAMDDDVMRSRAMEKVIYGYLEIKGTETIKRELLAITDLVNLSEETLNRLLASGCINQKQVAQAQSTRLSASPSAEKIKFGEMTAAATLAYKDRKFEEAISYIDEALAIKANYSSIWLMRGSILDGLNQYEEAIESYNKAIEINPNHHIVWLMRGMSLSILYRFEEAIESYEKAIELKPDEDKAWLLRGTVLSVLGRHEEAIESYNRTLKFKPSSNAAWYYRASAYLGRFIARVVQGKFESAKQDWQEALVSGEKLSEDTNWLATVQSALLVIAKSSHLNFVRQLITESDLEEHLFPLARAIDYLQTGDAALIEKLSPEVKGIVEEVVASLQKKEKEKETE